MWTRAKRPKPKRPRQGKEACREKRAGGSELPEKAIRQFAFLPVPKANLHGSKLPRAVCVCVCVCAFCHDHTCPAFVQVQSQFVTFRRNRRDRPRDECRCHLEEGWNPLERIAGEASKALSPPRPFQSRSPPRAL